MFPNEAVLPEPMDMSAMHTRHEYRLDAFFLPLPPSQAPRGTGAALLGVVALPYTHGLTPTTPRPHAKQRAAALPAMIPIERRPSTRHESAGTPPGARSMNQPEHASDHATRAISPQSRIVDRHTSPQEPGGAKVETQKAARGAGRLFTVVSL